MHARNGGREVGSGDSMGVGLWEGDSIAKNKGNGRGWEGEGLVERVPRDKEGCFVYFAPRDRKSVV